MTNPKDYRMTAKVRNNRILHYIELAGFKNVGSFCRAHGLCPSSVGELVNMRRRPILRDGSWCAEALRLAGILRITPDMLFSEAQRETELVRNHADAMFSQKQLMQMTNPTPESLLLEQEANDALHAAIDELDSLYSHALRARFGIDGPPQSLSQIAQHYDVTRERARQIVAKGLRLLRHQKTESLWGLLHG